MEHRRQVLSSDYYSQQRTSLDQSGAHLRERQPLADSAGNAQHHILVSVGSGHDSKDFCTGLDRPMYSLPTVPSQPARQPIGSTLDLRRHRSQRRRHMRLSRNPIIDSPQYQAYRDRQNRDGNPDELKWPEILEIAFLDALVEVPFMGRRKYSYKGKPHGRNELIKEYLWIAYVQSLPPGTPPDPLMMRTRKQVSSHIQVLKNFLKDHPAFRRLFPEKNGPRNGFEDSFKNDPCLKAISEGRLPNKMYEQYDSLNHLISSSHSPVRPVNFWLLMSSIDGFRAGDMNNENVVAHRFTNLSAQKQRESLESVTSWRQKFPQLHQLDSMGELNCDIIHMDATLNLLSAEPPPGSELVSQWILSIPGKQHGQCLWRMVTTLHKPQELYRDPIGDERLENEASPVDIILESDSETRIKGCFPILHWAHAFSCLATIQAQWEDQQRSLQSYITTSEPLVRPARDYIEQVVMYQEVQSAAGPGMPYIRRAVIVWTFHQAREGEGNVTNWRYLDPPPARRMCMSPSPHSSHLASSVMNETFGSWAETPLHLQQPLLDHFVQGLSTPPQSTGLQPPFDDSSYGFSNNAFELPVENLSFVSNSTVDSEITLVDHEATNSIETSIDNFLSNVNMAEYSQDPNTWHLPTTENFDADPAWANYTIPSTTPALGWDESKNHNLWPDLPTTEKHLNHNHNSNVNAAWADDGEENREWTEVDVGSPGKHCYDIEQSIEQKLLPWIDSHPNGDLQAGVHDMGPGEPLQEVDMNATIMPQPVTPKAVVAEPWIHPDDEFDYAQLERLK